jgi:hypothetical protein
LGISKMSRACPYCGKPALSFRQRFTIMDQPPYCQNCGERFEYTSGRHLILAAASTLFVFGGWVVLVLLFERLGIVPIVAFFSAWIIGIGALIWADRRWVQLKKRRDA